MNFDTRYYSLLKEQYPTRQSVVKEIINLSAITNLPKGTEYFMSDLHGEYQSFLHILNNCSGVIKEKIDLLFSDSLTLMERQELCTLIYYPNEKLMSLKKDNRVSNEWYKVTLGNLISVAKFLSSKYTRSKVRKAMPSDFSYIIDELLHVQEDEDSNQVRYHEEIMNTIIGLNNSDEFIVALSDLIKRLAVDHLHIVGDIYDRGGEADQIMNLLMSCHSIDIEWGNHDILWLGAFCGNEVSIATVIYNNLKYGNTDILEHAYGISLSPLMIYGMDRYHCTNPIEAAFRAIRVIMFKLEGNLIQKHPEYQMQEMLLLDKIDPDNMSVKILDQTYNLNVNSIDEILPTINWQNPYLLTEDEENIILKLKSDFSTSEKLRRHMDFILENGSMYKIYNGNLIYHGCVPLNEDGNFDSINIMGETYHGKLLLDKCDEIVRKTYAGDMEEGIDFMYFLWKGAKSPLCGRKLKTFEHEFIEKSDCWKEPSDPYYKHYYQENVCDMILREFGLYSQDSHIINGHTPVLEIEGEEPIRAAGKLFVIDGGFCRPMNKKTGIAGYTLIFNSHFLRLKGHTPFTSVNEVISNNADIDDTENIIVPLTVERLLVKDTDVGMELIKDIEDLKTLYEFYYEI